MNADEKRGYSKGYAAGLRRKVKADKERALARRRGAFWQRAYLALLPAAMQVQGWSFGKTPITSGNDRVELAKVWADRALQNFREIA